MMQKRRGRPRYAVGYIRVSTRRQAEEGNGIEAQAEAIRSYAHEHGYRMPWICEDTTSGNDRREILDRKEFRDAAEEAKRLRAVIIVVSIDRISRNSQKFSDFLRDEKVRIVAVTPGESESIEAQRRAVSRGQLVREAIVKGTGRALASRKQTGIVLGYPASLPAASRASQKVRGIASHLKVLDIRDLLLAHPALRNATAATVADALNTAGVLSGRGLKWTKHSIRRQLRLAREAAALVEEEDDDR